MPMMRHAAILGTLYVFIESMTSLSAIVFLVSPGNELAAVAIFETASNAFYGVSCAMSVTMLVIVFFVMGALWWLEHHGPGLGQDWRPGRRTGLSRRAAAPDSRHAARRPTSSSNRCRHALRPGARRGGVLSPVDLHALLPGDPQRARDLDRGRGRPSLHGLSRQQLPSPRLRPPPTDRCPQGTARRSDLHAAPVHRRARGRARRAARDALAGHDRKGAVRSRRDRRGGNGREVREGRHGTREDPLLP